MNIYLSKNATQGMSKKEMCTVTSNAISKGLNSAGSSFTGIYAIGAYYDEDASGDFIKHDIAGPGWTESDAPKLFQFIKSLKVGDIVYIKSAPPSSKYITVKAIGIIVDDRFVTNSSVVSIGRNIKWVITTIFKIDKPKEKNNVRLNTMYEEFYPDVQKSILDKLFD